MIKIRERGKFWLRRIHLEEMTLIELKKKILEKYNDENEELGEIYSIYELWDRLHAELSEDRLQLLQPGHELEVVFTRPRSSARFGYFEWLQKTSP